MYRSIIAKVNDAKSNISYIDSGGTHNFMNNKSIFKHFEEISPQYFKTAHGFSQIIVKGTININLDITITMEAYYAPDFSNNILSTHIIYSFLKVQMTSSIFTNKSCFLFKNGSLRVDVILMKVKCVNSLYPVDESSTNKVALAALTRNVAGEH